MKAVVPAVWGQIPPVREVDGPSPGPGESLVRFRTAGVNPVDLAIAPAGHRLALVA